MIAGVVKALEKRRIYAQYFSQKEAALAYITNTVTDKSIVGIGGSVTIEELGVEQLLEMKGCHIYWHWRAPAGKVMEYRLMNQRCDYFLTSTNALTQDGRLVNIDGTGNRVSSMIFGPKKIMVVVGTNKIVQNLDEAFHRIKTEAAPKNARRMGLELPCAVTGKCADCNSPRRMCNVVTIIEGRPRSTDMEVIIIGAELGL